jgi:hypothetical protein
MLDRVEFIFVTEVICQEQSKLLQWRDRVPPGRARHGEIVRISEHLVTVPEVAIMLIRRTDEKQNTRSVTSSMIASPTVKTSAKPAANNKAGHTSEGSDRGPFTCAKKSILTNRFDPVKHKGEDQVHTHRHVARDRNERDQSRSSLQMPVLPW